MGLSPTAPVPSRASERGAAAPTTLRFARVARALGNEARRLGLRAPGFRSPPGLPETDRTIRRADRGAVVSVRLHDRPFEAVVADMVDGVVAANALDPDAARRARVLLTHAALLELDADRDAGPDTDLDADPGGAVIASGDEPEHRHVA